MEKFIEKINIKTLFTQYDIFAYFIPGLIFVLGIFYFEFRIYNEVKFNTIHIPIYHGVTEIFKSVSSLNWTLSFFFIIISISLFYAVGHIVSSASSLLIDRILIYKGYGYPYEYLLNIKNKKCNPFSSDYYKGTFFLLNLSLLLIFLSVIINKLLFLKYVVIVFLIIIILFTTLKVFSSTKKYLKTKKLPVIRKNLFKFYGIFFNGIGSFLSQYINTRRAFNNKFIKKYKKYFKEEFDFNPKESESNNYWFSSIYIIDHSLELNQILRNWLNLYSFARNLSMSFFLIFQYCLISLFFQKKIISGYNLSISTKLFPLSMFLIFIILLIRYYYLYSSYYSKFVFRSFVYLKEKEFKKNKIQKINS